MAERSEEVSQLREDLSRLLPNARDRLKLMSILGRAINTPPENAQLFFTLEDFRGLVQIVTG
eukprot:CAMPEP_0177674484 /NCGR_PEP_ID=MMETSP0447-20121125/26585_1 /TAXON_ID=0 /ORGANISM="Stygamoeba regulata, Strain BSH-02190019" /LENGTH=61 /DNA_ID=CAMNT_0019182593 /DNA_START=121 /DNA_END=302 /DNA_ORIENTATION=+